jgi:hypothetical protein
MLVWEQAIVPWFAEFCGASDGAEVKPLLPEQAVMVSCAPYDLVIAKAVGCRTCWIRKIDPGTKIAVDAADEFPVVETMGELWMELFGNKHATEENKGRPIEDNKEQPGGKKNKKQPGGEEDEEGKMDEEIESEYEQEPWIL